MADEKNTATETTPAEPSIEELKAQIASLTEQNQRLKASNDNASSQAAEFKKKPFISGSLAYILGVVSVFTKKMGKKLKINQTSCIRVSSTYCLT